MPAVTPDNRYFAADALADLMGKDILLDALLVALPAEMLADKLEAIAKDYDLTGYLQNELWMAAE